MKIRKKICPSSVAGQELGRIVYSGAYHQFFTHKKNCISYIKFQRISGSQNKLGGQIWRIGQQEHFGENQNRRQTFKDCEFGKWADTTIPTLFQPPLPQIAIRKVKKQQQKTQQGRGEASACLCGLLGTYTFRGQSSGLHSSAEHCVCRGEDVNSTVPYQLPGTMLQEQEGGDEISGAAPDQDVGHRVGDGDVDGPEDGPAAETTWPWESWEEKGSR